MQDNHLAFWGVHVVGDVVLDVPRTRTDAESVPRATGDGPPADSPPWRGGNT